MRGGTLDGTTCCWDECLHGRRVVGAREGLRLRLGATDHRESQELFIDACIKLQDVQDFLLSSGPLGVGRVALLPEKLAGAQKGRRLLYFPTHDAAPLVQSHRQVPVRLYPVGVGRVHGRFTRWPDRHGFLNVGVAELGYHGQLWSEIVQVVLLLLHVALRDEHREVAILDPKLLDVYIEPLLNELPDPVGPRPQNEAALHRILLNQLRFHNHLFIPAWHVDRLLHIDSSTLARLLRNDTRGLSRLLFRLLFWLLVWLRRSWGRRWGRRGCWARR
mmetsp:Transcript_13927/g.32657  ORF Transcript_13927/g.32657 Transcript_13927/m.32657 type:complete len:275 (-) Transcript_13927:484-1308(-)